MTLQEEVTTRQGRLPGLLEKTVSGLWFLRNELAEFMDDGELNELTSGIEEVYDRAVVLQNGGRPFTPSFRLRCDPDHGGEVYLRVLLPARRGARAVLAGEVRMAMAMDDTQATLSLVREPGAHALARQYRWKAPEAELQALDELIRSAMRLKSLSRSIPVNIAFTDHGVEIGARYHDPAAQVRGALKSIV